jgi:hypothetical protein
VNFSLRNKTKKKNSGGKSNMRTKAQNTARIFLGQTIVQLAGTREETGHGNKLMATLDLTSPEITDFLTLKRWFLYVLFLSHSQKAPTFDIRGSTAFPESQSAFLTFPPKLTSTHVLRRHL